MLCDALEKIRRPHPHLLILVEEAQRYVKEARMRFRCHGEEKANLIVRMDMLGERDIDIFALCGRQPLVSESIVHVVKVKALEGPNCIELRKVLHDYLLVPSFGEGD